MRIIVLVFFMAIISLSIKASEKIVYYCEQDQMSIIDSKFIVDKYNKLSRTQRLISNFKINIQKEIIFYFARSNKEIKNLISASVII